MGAIKLSRRARWAIPAGALVITGGVMAGSLITVAQATPGLPARTPAQLLAEAGSSVTPPFTGTVVETANLGLPSLPSAGNPTSVASMLTGSHTVRVWYSSPQHFRLAVPSSLAETDVVRDGGTAWLWQSTANSVTEFTLPPHAQAADAIPNPAATLTPQQAANELLAKVGQTTTVSVDTNVMVAGRAAYELVLAPKDPRSLIGQIAIAIDGSNGLPLRVEVFAKGATSPAIQIGYTAIAFTAPASSELTFTPPPGAHVDKVDLTHGSGTGQASGNLSGAQVIGKGWLSVVELPSSALNSATGSPGGNGPGSSPGDVQGVLNALLGSAGQVSGSWGSGRLLHTSLINVLITDSGKMFIGAVDPSVLYAAAASAAAQG